ncbi:MAG: hypothetical protein IJZ51_10470 [Ruminiclostridium sp.]|nr:hypothetical protein [Ruminiclostridium sp.]
MNMIICSEPCRHQSDGCCLLKGAGVITNASLSPCRYFTPKDDDPNNYYRCKKGDGYADRA